MDIQLENGRLVTTYGVLEQVLELIERGILVQVVYEGGFWCYILDQLPSREDIIFSKEGLCQDKDLWAQSTLINNDWFLQEYGSYLEALNEGITEGIKLVKFLQHGK